MDNSNLLELKRLLEKEKYRYRDLCVSGESMTFNEYETAMLDWALQNGEDYLQYEDKEMIEMLIPMLTKWLLAGIAFGLDKALGIVEKEM